MPAPSPMQPMRRGALALDPFDARSSHPRASPLQLPQHGQDLLLQRFNSERTNLLVANDALLVDHEGLWHAVHPVIDADTTIPVDNGRRIRIAVLCEPLPPFDGIVLVVEAVHRNK